MDVPRKSDKEIFLDIVVALASNPTIVTLRPKPLAPTQMEIAVAPPQIIFGVAQQILMQVKGFDFGEVEQNLQGMQQAIEDSKIHKNGENHAKSVILQ